MQVKQAANHLREGIALLVLGGLLWCAPMPARGEESTGVQAPVPVMPAAMRIGAM
jgi:hypothetical protein